jgi:hypothetical protein
MKSYIFCLATILSIVGILTTTVVPALALGDNVQQIKTDLDGFALMPECCNNSTVHVAGNLITRSDGTMQLSSQTGILTIGTTSYGIKFEPSGMMSVKPETDLCISGTSYEQLGEIKLTGNDGITLKGLGAFSWSSSFGCQDGSSSFTYFGGKFNNTQGQTMEFFAGTDSMPIIH